MSLSQLIASTVMTFKADTSQYRAELKKMTGEEKAAAEATLKSIEKRNSSYESLAKGITKVNAVLGVANEVIRVGAASFKAYEENQRLSLAAANVSLGQLQRSSQGLRTDLDLLKLAAAGNAATFKSTEAQLKNAAAAMVAFDRAGFESTKVTEKVREAILKGNIEPLKELGINLDAAKSKQEQFAQLQDVLAKKAKEAGAGHASAGESFKRAAVEYDNAMREIKVAIGELVVALAPLLSALAKAVGLVADVVRGVGDYMDEASLAGGAKGLFRKYGGNLLGSSEVRQFSEARERRADGPAWESSFVDPRFQSKFDAQMALMEQMRALTGPQAQRTGGPGRYSFGGLGGISVEDRFGAGAAGGMGGFGGGDFGGGTAIDPRTAGRHARLNNVNAGTGFEGSADALSKLAADMASAGQQSALSKMFGPISEFDAYASAFGMLTGAAQAGFAAWIDGSMSAGQAIKKFFADSLKAMAGEMLGKAIQHGAYAIGSLAFGDAKGAATHGLAAAKFGAGAIAVGALAKLTGGGGASAGASAGAGASGGAPSVIGGGGGGAPVRDTRPINVFVGDVFAEDSPGAKAGRVQRAVRMAQRGGSGNVTWDN